MRREGVPFTLKALAVTGKDLQEIGFEGEQVGTGLKELLDYCTQDGRRNQRETLLRHAQNCKKETI